MVALMRRLHQEHAAMVKVLQVIEHQLDSLELGKRPDYELLEKAMEYCQEFPAQCHHPKEDLLYAKLRDYHQVADEVMTDLLAEHKALEENGARFLDVINKFRKEAAVPREQLLREGRDFLAFYRRHIDHEERGFFPTALECLTEDDWAEIDRRVVDRDDPVFGDLAEAGYRTLRNEILQNEAASVS